MCVEMMGQQLRRVGARVPYVMLYVVYQRVFQTFVSLIYYVCCVAPVFPIQLFVVSWEQDFVQRV